jgi:nucleoside-diphosphate-sugar epimerase
MSEFWRGKKTLITGGAAFIGSSLADALVERGACVRIVDNLSSGTLDNIRGHVESGAVEFIEGDLNDPDIARQSVKDIQVVFHLAADHGGRGYVDLHQVECSTNLSLDSIVIKHAHAAGVEKLVFASSGCVYPNFKQTNPDEILYLDESAVGPPYDADHLYGWAKLMGELTLQAYHKQLGFKCASCRYFTVYGPRGVENHAVIAMIARAFLKRNPFEVWGTGEQIRNWTYISDIVEGTILAAEKIDDGTAVNLGTMERVRVIDAVKEVLRYTGVEATIKTRPEMPTGPLNRVADNSQARKLLGWEPEVKFMDGLHKTIDWYFSTKTRDGVEAILERMLIER